MQSTNTGEYVKRSAGSTIVVVLIFCILVSCSSSESKEKPSEMLDVMRQKSPVEICVVKHGAFKKQFASNGILLALNRSDLRFGVNGTIRSLSVHNGDRLVTGQVIAVLEQYEYRYAERQAQANFRKAELQLRDILIGQGYGLSDSSTIPQETLETASIRSGYFTAKAELEDARYKLKSTKLLAPFGGILANLKTKRYEALTPGEVFCTIIDDSLFEVEFQLIESEVQDVAIGDSVVVTPYAQKLKKYVGAISEINPVIDKNGLITVKTRITNSGGLIEGMNVKVFVNKAIPRQLSVPRSAMVIRGGDKIIFKFVDGKAYWTYVQIDFQNSASYAVRAVQERGSSLQEGDSVIINGNLSLAHESEVLIK